MKILRLLKELKFLIKPDYSNQLNLSENLKNLSKQLAQVKIENIKKIKVNIIKDRQIGKIKIREQLLKDFPTKELRRIIDQGKKEIKSGMYLVFLLLKIKLE